jgi:hypothetical protein
LVRIQADEEKGLTIYLGAEFHPPAPPPEPEPVAEVEHEELEEDEPQPLVPGQPTATGEVPPPLPAAKPARRPRVPRKTASVGVTPKKRITRPRKKPPTA